MRNNILNIYKNLYYVSLLILIVIYFFPGSIIGYIFYGNLKLQPELISNPIGSSINHMVYFAWVTIILLVIKKRYENSIINLNLILFLSLTLELSHLILPYRAFEFYDLLGNFLGIFFGFIFYKILKFIKF